MALLAGCAVSNLVAGDFINYTVGDVLIGFRNGQANDLVVDAGPISTFTNLAPNQRLVIATFTGEQLGQVATKGVTWSAFSYLNDNTLFMTKARSSVNAPASAYRVVSSSSQHGTAGRIGQIPPGALDNIAYNVLNSVTAVVEPDVSAGNPNYLSGLSYHDAYVGSTGGFFNNTFSGNPENTTLFTFTDDGQPVRSDFFQLPPVANQLGKWLGYFEFNTNGMMSFVAYPSSTPAIKSISRAGDVSTIGYTTGLYGTYTLRGTNTLTSGVAATDWPAISTLTSGDTAAHTVTDTDSSPTKFYIITVQ